MGLYLQIASEALSRCDHRAMQSRGGNTSGYEINEENEKSPRLNVAPDYEKNEIDEKRFQSLAAEWLGEVQTMRRGDDPDWRSWSEGCRGRWARAMLALACDEGLDVAAEDRSWLEGLAMKDHSND